EPKLGGRCGACEFSKICGGCRCRAYATYGDYLAEDPACGYQPGAHGGATLDLPATLTFGLPVHHELAWDEGARDRPAPSPARAPIAIGCPWVLAAPRAWFERWVLSRRDFARILAVLVALRAVLVARIALTGAESMRMPSFGGGVPTSGAGAWLMAAIAAATAVMLARAAWHDGSAR